MEPLQLRPYQHAIVEDAENHNAIVMMPTGSGKTFVGAELIRRFLVRFPHKKALFLVPTIDLVEQQSRSLERWIGGGFVVHRYHGGLSLPKSNFTMLVTTPQAFLDVQVQMSNQAEGGGPFGFQHFGICVFDEVHHVLKDHPYRKIALKLKHFVSHCDGGEERNQVTVVGLSASLTYAVCEVSVKKALDNLCSELMISKMCSPTEEELLRGGYKPREGNIEICDAVQESPIGVLPISERVPHEMHKTFLKRIKEKSATRFSLLIWDTIQLLEVHARKIGVFFKSPLSQPKLCSWEEYANKQQRSNPKAASFFQLLEDWYVALRLVIVSWEEDEPLVLSWLLARRAFENQDFFEPKLHLSIEKVHNRAMSASNFRKLNALRQQLLDKKNHFGEAFRCIVFVQQRIGAYVIAHFINKDSTLKALDLKANYVAAKRSKMTPSIKVSPTHSSTVLNQFRVGEIDIVVATSVAEEGLDVPSANVVISYNYMKDAVELCQRGGRARQLDSHFVIMEQRPDRPISRLQSVQRIQETVVQDFTPNQKPSVEQLQQKMDSQRQRERAARHLLLQCRAEHPGGKKSCLMLLNEFRQKTKGNVDTIVNYGAGKVIVITRYSSMIRSEEARGEGTSKKIAIQDSARAMLLKLAERLC